jgi:lipopolysaccharide transport system permease protein
MEASSQPAPQVIEPSGGAGFPSLGEIWRRRDLLYYLARREIAARYKQSVIGVAWVILQPVLLAIVFSVFFGQLAKVPSQTGVPYPVFAVSGMVLWLFFSAAATTAAESTIANEELISKVYFPRAIIPIAAVLPATVDFIPALFVVLATMLIYGMVPQIQVLLMPVVVVFLLATALGIGFWLSALNVKYRDVGHLIPFMVLVGLFVSPITYPLKLVPDHLQALYAINPIVGILEAYRWMLFGSSDWSPLVILIPVVASVLVLLSGAAYFQRAQRGFADVI